MNLRNNVYNGSIQSSNPGMQNCTGDSQFSEDHRCRLNDGLYNRFRPRQLGLCPNLIHNGDEFESVFNINRLHRGVYTFPGVNCSDPHSNHTNPLLIIAQGGVHMGNNPGPTFHKLVAPFFRDRAVQQCATNPRHRVIFIFVSYQAQSASYDAQFPLQAASKGLKFNADMTSILNQSGVQNIAVVDWYSFTKGAMHSDGLHFAAQVNYFKVQHLVALADRMVKEQRWLGLENVYEMNEGPTS